MTLLLNYNSFTTHNQFYMKYNFYKKTDRLFILLSINYLKMKFKENLL